MTLEFAWQYIANTESRVEWGRRGSLAPLHRRNSTHVSSLATSHDLLSKTCKTRTRTDLVLLLLYTITTMIPNTLRTSRSFSSAFDFTKFAGLTGGAFDRCRRRRRREGGSVGRGSCCSGRRKSGWSVSRCWCCGVASNKAVKSVSENKSGRKTFSVAFVYGCEALAPS